MTHSRPISSGWRSKAPLTTLHNLYLALTLKEALHCQTLATRRRELLLYHPTEGHPLGREADGRVQHRAVFLADHAFERAGTYLLSVRH